MLPTIEVKMTLQAMPRWLKDTKKIIYIVSSALYVPHKAWFHALGIFSFNAHNLKP